MGLEREQVAAQTDQTYPPSKRHMLLQFWYSISKRMLGQECYSVECSIWYCRESSQQSPKAYSGMQWKGRGVESEEHQREHTDLSFRM